MKKNSFKYIIAAVVLAVIVIAGIFLLKKPEGTERSLKPAKRASAAEIRGNRDIYPGTARE